MSLMKCEAMVYECVKWFWLNDYECSSSMLSIGAEMSVV
jgi:hypothetical protein